MNSQLIFKFHWLLLFLHVILSPSSLKAQDDNVVPSCENPKENFVYPDCTQCKPNFKGSLCDECSSLFEGPACNVLKISDTTHFEAGSEFSLEWKIEHGVLYLELSARTIGWIAVGFSPSGSMDGQVDAGHIESNSDIILVWVGEKGGHVLDLTATKYKLPEIDEHQDVFFLKGYQEVGSVEKKRQLENGTIVVTDETTAITDETEMPTSTAVETGTTFAEPSTSVADTVAPPPTSPPSPPPECTIFCEKGYWLDPSTCVCRFTQLRTSVAVVRKLDTGDVNDFVIDENAVVNVIFAKGNDDPGFSLKKERLAWRKHFATATTRYKFSPTAGSCDPEITCNGNGYCDDDGKCVCDRIWFGPHCNAKGTDTNGNCATLREESYTMCWEVTGENKITITASAKTQGWIGVGFSYDSRMTNSDFVIGWDSKKLRDKGEASAYIMDAFSARRAQPLPDFDVGGRDGLTNTKVVDDEETGWVTMEFTRDIESDDERDVSIPREPSDDFFILYAYGSNDGRETGFSGHTTFNKGAAKINFFDVPSIPSEVVDDDGNFFDTETWYRFHGFLMVVSFFVIFPAGIFIARYNKKNKKFMKIHLYVQFSGACIVYGSFFLAVLNTETDQHFRKVHNILGLVICTFLLTHLLVALQRPNLRSKRRKHWEVVHRWAGRAFFPIVATINVALGFYSLEEWIGMSISGFVIIMVIAIFLVKELARKKRGGISFSIDMQ